MSIFRAIIAYPAFILFLWPNHLWAVECIQVNNNLNYHISCLQIGEVAVEADLIFSYYLASDNLAWEVDDYWTTTPSGHCDVASAELNFKLSCVKYAGQYYKVDFISKVSPVANLGIFWELKAATLIPTPAEVEIPPQSSKPDIEIDIIGNVSP